MGNIYKVDSAKIELIADSIREQLGETDEYYLSEMPDKISEISGSPDPITVTEKLYLSLFGQDSYAYIDGSKISSIRVKGTAYFQNFSATTANRSASVYYKHTDINDPSNTVVEHILVGTTKSSNTTSVVEIASFDKTIQVDETWYSENQYINAVDFYIGYNSTAPKGWMDVEITYTYR